MRIAAIFNPPNRHQSERRQRRERTPRHVGFEFNAIRRRQRHRSTVRALLPAAIGLALFTAPAAFAAEPCGNQTCDLGTTCETTEPDCADCEAAYRCVYADCASDSDCADYMVCVAWTEPDCPEQSSGCEPDETDEECAARWDEYEATCDVVEYQQCQLRWEQHCQQASDCGDGFECWPYYSCECPNDQPSDYFRSAIDGCTCEVRDEGYCELLEETCEEDADCPEGMQCLQFNSGPCVVPEGGGEEDCVYTEHVLKCVPRMLGVVVPQSATATLGESGSEAELSSGDQASSAESAEQPAGEEPELSSDLGAEADGTDDAETASPDGADSAESTEQPADQDSESSNDSSADEGAKQDDSKAESDGCSVQAGGAGSSGDLAALLLGLTVIAGGATHRRRRATGSA